MIDMKNIIIRALIFLFLLYAGSGLFANTVRVLIGDRNSNENLNLHNGAAVTITYPHEKGHDGLQFETCTINIDVADEASTNMLLNPGYEAHLVGSVSSEGKAYVFLYEDPSTTGGTTINVICTNRNNPKTTTSTIHFNPTISSVGTKLTCELLNGGEGPRSPGGSASRAVEWILDPDKTYLLQIVNKAGSAKDHGVNLIWYEEQ